MTITIDTLPGIDPDPEPAVEEPRPGSRAARMLMPLAKSVVQDMARLRLDSRIRQKVDPEDVLQSVYKSFFLRCGAGQFDLSGWDLSRASSISVSVTYAGYYVGVNGGW